MESESEKVDDSEEATEFQVIPVHLVETYRDVEGVALASPTSSNIVLGNNSSTKGKYYKQTYRRAWEQMPDFKGWLKGVEGEPTRAYCTYCHKSLHAHRLSLLKHTCTIRHQKAAQFYNSRKNVLVSVKKSDFNATFDNKNDDKSNRESNENEDADENVEILETVDLDDKNSVFDFDNDEEEEDEETYPEKQTVQNDSKLKGNSLRPAVSTKVTDLSKGRPIVGLQVSLYKLIDGRWTYISEGVTGSNGKYNDFLPRNDFTPGRYKLHYDVDRYFETKKQETMYPFIEIVFDCTLLTETRHIPLLLSPYGYTTYKG